MSSRPLVVCNTFITMQFTILRNKQPHNEELITLKCPKTPLALGAPPRLSYPLVIFLTREFDSEDHLHPNESVSETRRKRKWNSFLYRYTVTVRGVSCQWVSYNLPCLDNTTYQQKCKKRLISLFNIESTRPKVSICLISLACGLMDSWDTPPWWRSMMKSVNLA